MEWERPSGRICELIRRGAEVVLNVQADWLDELDRATLASDRSVADDPVLAGAVRRTNRANVLHWAAANVRDPGMPVPANLGPEPLAVTRDMLRRGLDQSALNIYRVGQNFAWRRWMDIAFELTSDPTELHELLDVTSRSVSSFIDATIAGAMAQMQLERDELTRGTHAERREVVALILDGAPISLQRAEARLGYGLNQFHTAAVVWSEEAEPDQGQLDRAAEALARSVGSVRPLSVIASAGSRWVWVASASGPDPVVLADQVAHLPGVRIAVGPTARGIEGFRRSHLDALTTQRMLARLHSAQRVASFNDIQLVALITLDPERADQFIKHTLGDLESADAELRHTVWTFVNEQCNASRAAARLYTHRNTLLRRITRAERLLPRPLEDNSVHVAVALEALHWRGEPA
jgi:DNA-binding PucR family transcriptional regulator